MSDLAADRELTIEILRLFGFKYDELTSDELSPADGELLASQIGLGATQRPTTVGGTSLGPAGAAAAAAVAAATAGASATAGSAPGAAKGGRGGAAAGAGATRGGGRGAAAGAARGGRRGTGGPATAAAATATAEEAEADPDAGLTPAEVEAREKEAHLNRLRDDVYDRPRCLIGVFGGAGGLHDLLVPNLRRLVKRGAVAAAVMSGGMILDGGTAAGVMDMIGASLASCHPKTMRLLGVSPAKLVLKPGEKSSDPNSSPLEPHHTNFVLVPSAEWGGETSTMFCFAAVLAAKIPMVSVLANGGMISKKEILNAVRHHIPVVVIEGSGRLADQVRHCWYQYLKPHISHPHPHPYSHPHPHPYCHSRCPAAQISRAQHRRDETPPEEFDPSILIPDPDVREIVMTGEIRLFNVTGSAEHLQRILLDILASQRDRLLLAGAATAGDGATATTTAAAPAGAGVAGASGVAAK